MQLDTDLRQTLWNARHWERVLCERAAALRARPVSGELAEPARALAAALEDVVLDRSHAVEMYLVASKAAGGDATALSRARALALEIGELGLAARIASLERKRTGQTALALVEGQAWLDAGDPDRAIKPLLVAVRAHPDDAAAARALAAARREWADVRGELDRVQRAAAAQGDPEAAARDFLHASRIARMLGEAARARALIEAAFSRDPRCEVGYALVERELVRAGEWGELVGVYRQRCDAVATSREVVDTLRRGATRMSVTDGAPAMAVTLAVRALGYAYDEGVADIPGHLALVDILCRHYVRARAAEKVLPVIDRGLEAGLPDDDEIALAITGLELAWGQLGSAATAQRYAAQVEACAPAHPALAEYRRGGGLRRATSEPGGEVSLPEPLELADEPSFASAAEPSAGQHDEVSLAEPLELEVEPLELEAESSRAATVVEPSAFEHVHPIESPQVDDELSDGSSSAQVAEPAPLRSPVPPQATPPAPDLEDMIELDPDELEELEVEELEVDGSADHADPVASPPPPEPRSPPPKRPPSGVPSQRPATQMGLGTPMPPKSPAKPRRAATELGVGKSLIPGSAKKALEDIVRASPHPPGHGAEKRADDRVAVPADAEVAIAARVVLGGGGARAVTRDVSASGAFIVTDAPLPRDTAFALTLSLPTPDAMGLFEHALRAVVVREEPGVGYGIRFESPGSDFVAAVARLRGSH